MESAGKKRSAPILFSGSGLSDPLSVGRSYLSDDPGQPSATSDDPEDAYLANAIAQNAAEAAIAGGKALYPSIKQATTDYTPQEAAKSAFRSAESPAYLSKYYMPQTKGFNISVCNPTVKEERMLSKYVVYVVKGNDGSGGFEALRRYSDFLALRNSLARKWPGVYIPAIPPKQMLVFFTQGKFSPEFIEDRRVMLEDFLQRLVIIDFLVSSEEFQLFLRGTEEFEKECAALKVYNISEIAANYTNHFTTYANTSADPMPRLIEEEKFFTEVSGRLKALKDITKRTAAQYAAFQTSYSSLSSDMEWLENTYLPTCIGRDYRPLFHTSKRDIALNPYSLLHDWVKCELLDCMAAAEAIEKIREMDITRRKNAARLENEKSDLQKLQGGGTLLTHVLTFKSRDTGIATLEASIKSVAPMQLTEETQFLGVIMRIASVRLLEYELPRVKAAKEDVHKAAMRRFALCSKQEFAEVMPRQLARSYRAVSESR